MKEKFKKIGKWILDSFIWLGVIIFVLDIVSKNVIVANRANIENSISADGSQGIDVIPHFLRINYVINNKLVMGLDLGNDLANRIVFCVLALSIVTGVIIFLIKKWDKINRYYKACIMMVIAGAIGNVIDRIFYSPEYLGRAYNGVVDFIDFYFWDAWKFNFNIADSSVVVAAFMLLIYMIVTETKDYIKSKKEEEPKKDEGKVLSKTEQEKAKLLTKKEDDE